jgi:hypothetical protein
MKSALLLLAISMVTLAGCSPPAHRGLILPPTPPPIPTLSLDEANRIRDLLHASGIGTFGEGSAVGGPLTVREIEQRSLREISQCSSCPQVPFGYANAAWKEFKSKVRRGDRIIYFVTDTASWRHLGGREGYALIRGARVVDSILTKMN